MVELGGLKYYLCVFGDVCWLSCSFPYGVDASRCTTLMLTVEMISGDVNIPWAELPRLDKIKVSVEVCGTVGAVSFIKYYIKHIHDTGKKFVLESNLGEQEVEDVFQLQELLLSVVKEDKL